MDSLRDWKLRIFSRDSLAIHFYFIQSLEEIQNLARRFTEIVL